MAAEHADTGLEFGLRRFSQNLPRHHLGQFNPARPYIPLVFSYSSLANCCSRSLRGHATESSYHSPQFLHRASEPAIWRAILASLKIPHTVDNPQPPTTLCPVYGSTHEFAKILENLIIFLPIPVIHHNPHQRKMSTTKTDAARAEKTRKRQVGETRIVNPAV